MKRADQILLKILREIPFLREMLENKWNVYGGFCRFVREKRKFKVNPTRQECLDFIRERDVDLFFEYASRKNIRDVLAIVKAYGGSIAYVGYDYDECNVRGVRNEVIKGTPCGQYKVWIPFEDHVLNFDLYFAGTAGYGIETDYTANHGTIRKDYVRLEKADDMIYFCNVTNGLKREMNARKLIRWEKLYPTYKIASDTLEDMLQMICYMIRPEKEILWAVRANSKHWSTEQSKLRKLVEKGLWDPLSEKDKKAVREFRTKVQTWTYGPIEMPAPYDKEIRRINAKVNKVKGADIEASIRKVAQKHPLELTSRLFNLLFSED